MRGRGREAGKNVVKGGGGTGCGRGEVRRGKDCPLRTKGNEFAKLPKAAVMKGCKGCLG